MDKEIMEETILLMAKKDMNVSAVARKAYVGRSTMSYRIEEVKKHYGLDPLKFYDLCKLVEMVKGD